MLLPKLRTRQEYFLSPLLFSLVLEGLTRAVKNESEIKSVMTGN